LRLLAAAKDTYGHEASGGRCGGKTRVGDGFAGQVVLAFRGGGALNAFVRARSRVSFSMRSSQRVIDPSRTSSGEREVHVGVGYLLYAVADDIIRPAFILLTARDAKEDVIDGLNSGADDYLGKPFEPQEFIARVRAVLRRPRLIVPTILSFGNVELHVGSNEVTVANNKVLLRRREALILEALLMRRERVIARDALIEAIYGFDDEIESNTLEAQVSRLRKKLAEVGGNVDIRAMRGIGYILRMAQT
jgi:DNA-binding winged helix-turn-helix (wHTH) protein